MKSNAHRVARTGVALVAFTVITACGSAAAASSGGVNAATAQSATAFGGMSGLIDAAKKEGELNVIALPPDLGQLRRDHQGFSDKVRHQGQLGPARRRQPGRDQRRQPAERDKSTAPDVFDLGQSVALANTGDVRAVQGGDVRRHPDRSIRIPTASGSNDYGGYMSIGYDSAKVPDHIECGRPDSKPEFKGEGRAQRRPDPGRRRVHGRDDGRGRQGRVARRHRPRRRLLPEAQARRATSCPRTSTPATIESGQTPVVIDWDYLNTASVVDQAATDWKVFIPSNAALGGYYYQAIDEDAPHPAAARLWQEFLFCPQNAVGGQNLFLAGWRGPV